MAVQLNSQFTQFVKFAQRQMDAENTKAIARDSGGAPFGTGLLPFGGGFNADEISGPDILDDLMN